MIRRTISNRLDTLEQHHCVCQDAGSGRFVVTWYLGHDRRDAHLGRVARTASTC
jgi:hypothetical protein